MTSDQLPDPAVTTTPPEPTSSAASDSLLRDYHDARRREDQWRIPQLLLALAAPILSLISVLFAFGGNGTYAIVSGAVAIVAGAGAALVAIEVWRWHRTAFGIVNRFRQEHPGDVSLLMKDPL